MSTHNDSAAGTQVPPLPGRGMDEARLREAQVMVELARATPGHALDILIEQRHQRAALIDMRDVALKIAAERDALATKLSAVLTAARAYHAACEASARATPEEIRACALRRYQAFIAMGNAGYDVIDEDKPAFNAASIHAIGHCEEPGCDDGATCTCPCDDCREVVAGGSR